GRPIVEGPVVVHIKACFLPPQSMSQKALRAASAGFARPTKLDCDNIAKAVQDSCLTGIVIRDDRQIVTLTVEKWFDDCPRVEITLTPWTGIQADAAVKEML